MPPIPAHPDVIEYAGHRAEARQQGALADRAIDPTVRASHRATADHHWSVASRLITASAAGVGAQMDHVAQAFTLDPSLADVAEALRRAGLHAPAEVA